MSEIVIEISDNEIKSELTLENKTKNKIKYKIRLETTNTHHSRIYIVRTIALSQSKQINRKWNGNEKNGKNHIVSRTKITIRLPNQTYVLSFSHSVPNRILLVHTS